MTVREEKELFVYVGYVEVEDLEDEADLQKLKHDIKMMNDEELDAEVEWVDHLLDK